MTTQEDIKNQLRERNREIQNNKEYQRFVKQEGIDIISSHNQEQESQDAQELNYYYGVTE